MDILVVDEEVNEVKEKGTEKKLHGYERDDGTGKKNSFAKIDARGCPTGYPQLLLLYSRVNGRAVVSIQDTGFREYLSSTRSR